MNTDAIANNAKKYKAASDKATQEAYDAFIADPMTKTVISALGVTEAQLTFVRAAFNKGFNAGAGHEIGQFATMMIDGMKRRDPLKDPSYDLGHKIDGRRN